MGPSRRFESDPYTVRVIELAIRFEGKEMPVEEFIAALGAIVAERAAAGYDDPGRSVAEVGALYKQLKDYPLDQYEKLLSANRLLETVQHWRLLQVVSQLPLDYEGFGTASRESADGTEWYSDCSCGCRWYFQLPGVVASDWGCCTNPRSHRCGLLTFEHQGCPQFELDPLIEAEFERRAAEQREQLDPDLRKRLEALRREREQSDDV